MKQINETVKEQIQNYIDEIEEIRIERGLSITELSEMAYGKCSAYTQLKSFRNMPSLATLNNLAEALGRHVIICLSEDD